MSSGVERCRGAVSSGVEGCRGVSRCRVWHLDTDEHGFSLDGVEGCRGVSRGVEFVELAWVVEVSSRCRGLVSRCRGQGSGREHTEQARMEGSTGETWACPCERSADLQS